LPRLARPTLLKRWEQEENWGISADDSSLSLVSSSSEPRWRYRSERAVGRGQVLSVRCHRLGPCHTPPPSWGTMPGQGHLSRRPAEGLTHCASVSPSETQAGPSSEWTGSPRRGGGEGTWGSATSTARGHLLTVEVAGVVLGLQLGDELGLVPQKPGPVQGPEERVLLHLVGATCRRGR
jgi:hypothetical protein